MLGTRKQREWEDAWSALVSECADRLKKERRELAGVDASDVLAYVGSSADGDDHGIGRAGQQAGQAGTATGLKPAEHGAAGVIHRTVSLPKAVAKHTWHARTGNGDVDSPYMPASPLRSSSVLSADHSLHGQPHADAIHAIHGLASEAHSPGATDQQTNQRQSAAAILRHAPKPLITGGPCENPYCGVSEAPQWRRIEKRLVCNRCGMYHHRHGRFPDAAYFVLMNNKRQFHAQSMAAAAQLLERTNTKESDPQQTSSGGTPHPPSSPPRQQQEQQQQTVSDGQAQQQVVSHVRQPSPSLPRAGPAPLPAAVTAAVQQQQQHRRLLAQRATPEAQELPMFTHALQHAGSAPVSAGSVPIGGGAGALAGLPPRPSLPLAPAAGGSGSFTGGCLLATMAAAAASRNAHAAAAAAGAQNAATAAAVAAAQQQQQAAAVARLAGHAAGQLTGATAAAGNAGAGAAAGNAPTSLLMADLARRIMAQQQAQALMAAAAAQQQQQQNLASLQGLLQQQAAAGMVAAASAGGSAPQLVSAGSVPASVRPAMGVGAGPATSAYTLSAF